LLHKATSPCRGRSHGLLQPRQRRFSIFAEIRSAGQNSRSVTCLDAVGPRKLWLARGSTDVRDAMLPPCPAYPNFCRA
jgi:hypothetical protein